VPSDATSSRGSAALIVPGVLIASAFGTIAWLEPRTGDPIFMAAVGVAALGYVFAAARLAANAVLSPRALFVCLALALAWRAPLLTLPPAPAHDAVRYMWDARVVRAGLNPYETRPDDAALQGLHSEVTRDVDASWLPTIYPPMAQVYFLAVTAVDESITAFRVAAWLCDAAIMAALAWTLRHMGQPLGWALLYAWHPLVPLEGASGAHLELVGVLMLLLSWLSLLHGRSMTAAVTFAAAVLVKPLPLVLAPLYWRRICARDALLATTLAGVVTAWIARGHLPFGSTGEFVDTFRFNGPLFATMEAIGSARVIAAGAVLAGLIAAAWLRKARDIAAPEAWAWPMTIALVASPVVYPWYLVWLIPFAIGRAVMPVWVWTLTVLVVYPAWQIWRVGAPFAVPPVLLLIEFAVPAAVAVVLLARLRPSLATAARTAHG
jgi:hypothetical protein